jgi:hypothetical protein
VYTFSFVYFFIHSIQKDRILKIWRELFNRNFVLIVHDGKNFEVFSSKIKHLFLTVPIQIVLVNEFQSLILSVGSAVKLKMAL